MPGVSIPPRGPPPEYPFANRSNNTPLAPGANPSAPSQSHPSLVPGVNANASVVAGSVGTALPSAAASAPPLASSGQSPSGSVYFGHDPKENGMVVTSCQGKLSLQKLSSNTS